MNDFATALQLHRQRARMTQYRLAHECGFVPSYISRLESGNRNPSRTAICKIVDAMHADRDTTTALYHAAGFLVPGESHA